MTGYPFNQWFLAMLLGGCRRWLRSLTLASSVLWVGCAPSVPLWVGKDHMGLPCRTCHFPHLAGHPAPAPIRVPWPAFHPVPTRPAFHPHSAPPQTVGGFETPHTPPHGARPDHWPDRAPEALPLPAPAPPKSASTASQPRSSRRHDGGDRNGVEPEAGSLRKAAALANEANPVPPEKEAAATWGFVD
ncbi:MAG: hypothetical protein KatS3mg110_4289 [Pirellulaceae bacterium]|nr:MAG: hypothetical protein KatS3mg110_4289 [Pirellulaceae bacterium]